MADPTDAPGLRWRIRKNGQRVAYWCARAELIKRGYRPKNVRLHFEDEAALYARCRILQAEMLEWASGQRPARGAYDGTLRSLVRLYETDPDSPYRDLKQGSAITYSKHLRLLMERVGERRVDLVTGADVVRWYKLIKAPTIEGGPERTGYAHLMISILKAVVSYGAVHNLPGCLTLRKQMAAARLKKAGPRSSRLTHGQVIALREVAHIAGRPSMALGITLQFDLAFRQRDVIGEWIVDAQGTDGIRIGRRVWQNGLTWGHIDSSRVLRKTTTKTAAPAAHRITDYPDLTDELDRIPGESRVGPLVINERTGLPYTPEQYRRAFRRLARAAGVPDGVWNMDARAGAITEAYEAGAGLTEAMSLGTHTQASTSRGYNRDALEQSSRAARLRVGSRKVPS